MSADLVILIPMLGRPHRVAPLLQTIHEATPAARVLFLTTPDDAQVRREISRHGREQLTVPRRPTGAGDYARKINAGYRHTTEPHIFLGADDLHFHPGWYEAAIAELGPGIGVVGTDDMGSPRVIAGEHSTHSLVTREYADRGTVDQPRTIYHEGYIHEYVDDELVGTAKHRGAWAFARDAKVEHLHPNWGKAPTDRSYAQQRERIRRGRPLFLRRQTLWT